jgi:hypothetical protein
MFLNEYCEDNKIHKFVKQNIYGAFLVFQLIILI